MDEIGGDFTSSTLYRNSFDRSVADVYAGEGCVHSTTTLVVCYPTYISGYSVSVVGG